MASYIIPELPTGRDCAGAGAKAVCITKQHIDITGRIRMWLCTGTGLGWSLAIFFAGKYHLRASRTPATRFLPSGPSKGAKLVIIFGPDLRCETEASWSLSLCFKVRLAVGNDGAG
jgi:hypothetical protein